MCEDNPNVQNLLEKDFGLYNKIWHDLKLLYSCILYIQFNIYDLFVILISINNLIENIKINSVNNIVCLLTVVWAGDWVHHIYIYIYVCHMPAWLRLICGVYV